MIVALTGATGFVGRAVLAELLRRGHAVRALVRAHGVGEPPSVDPPRVTRVLGDLHDEPALASLVEGAQAVVHAAGRVPPASLAELTATNVVGTAHLARAAGGRHVVHVSSVAVYDPRLRGALSTAAALLPPSDYGVSKRAAEAHLPPDAAILRPAIVYGPGDRRFGPALARYLRRPWAFGVAPGENLLPLVHVRSVALAAVKAVELRASGVFNLGDDGPLSQRALLDRAAAMTGQRVPLLPRALGLALRAGLAVAGKAFGPDFLDTGVTYLTADTWRALDFQPPVPYADGLDDLLNEQRPPEPGASAPPARSAAPGA